MAAAPRRVPLSRAASAAARAPEPAIDPRAPSLAALEARVRYELDCLAYPETPWIDAGATAAGQPVLTVLIVGAGQAGLATWFALRREGVRGVAIVDRAAAGEEGPWATFARMPTLRTPKYLTGPDDGIPSLTFRAWYEAQDLAPSWPELDRIPTRLWMAYLVWFRRVLAIPVRNRTAMTGFRQGADGAVAVELETPAGPEQVLARKLVIANGIDGGGAWSAPESLMAPLPREAWRHSSDAIDFAALAGRRVAVLGIGASALDNAAAALDHGAARVDLFFRRSAIPRIEVRAWLEQSGFLRAFAGLDDGRKWSVMSRLLGVGAPPPAWSLERLAGDGRAVFHADSAWRATRWTGSAVEIETRHGAFEADLVIFGTGAVIDPRLRPELAAHAGAIALWRDRFAPPAGEPCPAMERYPYLGPGFELTERRPGQAPWLANVHLFNWAATASLGITGSSITGLKFGLRRLVTALVADLYRADADRHLAAMPWHAHAAPE